MGFLEKLNWTTILSILVAVELQIGSGQMSLAHMFPDAWIPFIQAWSSNLGSIGATVMAVLSYGNKRVPGDAIAIKTFAGQNGMENLQSGDHVSIAGGAGTSSAVGKVVGALLLAILANSFVLTHHASAQTPRVPAPAATIATGNFLAIIKGWISADIDGAISLATAIPDLQDPNGAACWKAFKGIGEVINAHPLPVTLKLASDVQSARLIAISLKKVCSEPACAQVWLDLQNQIAALAPMGVPFTLTSLCAKVL